MHQHEIPTGVDRNRPDQTDDQPEDPLASFPRQIGEAQEASKGRRGHRVDSCGQSGADEDEEKGPTDGGIARTREGIDQILRSGESQTRSGAVDEAVGRIVKLPRQKDNENHPEGFRGLLDEGADPDRHDGGIETQTGGQCRRTDDGKDRRRQRPPAKHTDDEVQGFPIIAIEPPHGGNHGDQEDG